MNSHNTRANWPCPECGSNAVSQVDGNIFQCRNCKTKIHEAVAEEWDALEQVAKRNDTVGEFAKKLMETGGIANG